MEPGQGFDGGPSYRDKLPWGVLSYAADYAGKFAGEFNFSGIDIRLYRIYYIGHSDSTPSARSKERLLSDSPNMTNEVLNDSFESLFFADQAIPPL